MLRVGLLGAIAGELCEDGAFGTFKGEIPCEDGAFGELSASSCDDKARGGLLTREDLRAICYINFNRPVLLENNVTVLDKNIVEILAATFLLSSSFVLQPSSIMTFWGIEIELSK